MAKLDIKKRRIELPIEAWGKFPRESNIRFVETSIPDHYIACQSDSGIFSKDGVTCVGVSQKEVDVFNGIKKADILFAFKYKELLILKFNM